MRGASHPKTSVKLPHPRGALSDALTDLLNSPAARPSTARLDLVARGTRAADAGDPLHDEDLQLALYVMYELSYRGFAGVDDEWEWDPELLRTRAVLESAYLAALRESVVVPDDVPADRSAVAAALFAMTAPTPGPSLARFVAKRATVDQAREFLVHRSIYQLKEADPHSWAIPRLEGRAKAALVEIQADEYGGGAPERMHAELFARTMRGVGLDAHYGAYIEQVPAVTLAGVNLMSLLGLHRRWRGAIVGHLAAFEMTSCVPNRRYGDGLRRLGFGPDALAYFDEHVEADAVHEAVAANDLAGSLVAAEPELEDDVLFGARALCVVEATFAERLIAAWRAGRSSLLEPPIAA